jgi:predicted small lipoprotein YifL
MKEHVPMTMRRLATWSVALVALLALAGCGDDDADDATSDDTVTDTTTDEAATDGDDASADLAVFCTDLVALQSDEPEVPEGASEEEARQIEERYFREELVQKAKAVHGRAPASVADEFGDLIAILEDKGPAFEDPEMATAITNVNDAAMEECDIDAVEVVGVEYAYEGAPSTLDAGPVGFRFVNEGDEPHEMVVARRNDDVTLSFDELLEIPFDEVKTKIEPYGGYSALPGEHFSRIISLPPGDYVMACFVPVGSTADGQIDRDAPPHFTQGMKHEFTVE